MAVDLAEFVDSLRREVTPPGSDLFATVPDDTFVGYLTDAFWEARLDGFMAKWEADVDGFVVPLDPDGEDLPRELVGLVVLYAGIKILRNRIMNLNTAFRSKAGPVEYEVQNSANLLTELLKQLAARKEQILEAVENIPTPTFYFDAYSTRQQNAAMYWGELSGYLTSLAN